MTQSADASVGAGQVLGSGAAQWFGRLRRGGVASLCSGALALGCQAGVGGANPEGPTWLHQPSGTMQLVYTRNLLAQSRDMGEQYESGGLALDLAGRRVFAGSRDHGMYALSAQDGTILWRFETMGPAQGTPLYDAATGHLYFGSNDGAVYKVHSKDGSLIWRFSTQAEVNRRPVLRGDTLFVSNANDTFLALNADSGELLWTQHRAPAMGMEISGSAGPLVWRDQVFAAFSDGTVTSFHVDTGEELWAPVDMSAATEQGSGKLPTYLDVDTTPVISSSGGVPTVVVASYEGGVAALQADNGMRVWSNSNVAGANDIYLWTQPERPGTDGALSTPERQLLVVSTGMSGLWGLDPETGEEVWHRDIPLGGASQAVPALGGLLFSTTQAGLFFLSPLDGRVIDGIHTGAGFSMPPVAYGQRAFILSNAGKFYALHLSRPR